MIRQHLGLVVFTAVYTLATFARSLATGNMEFAAYSAQIVCLSVLVMWAHRRARFSSSTLWALSVWGLLHMAGGTVPAPLEWVDVEAESSRARLYYMWLIPGWFRYDHFVHGYGFFVATVVLWQSVRRSLRPGSAPSLAFGVLLASAGMGLGAANEILEFIATLALEETGVGGYVNTAMDLVWNAVGACAATGIIWWRHRRGFPDVLSDPEGTTGPR